MAGDLQLHGNVGSRDPLENVTVGGRMAFNASSFVSDGEIVTNGPIELQRAGAVLSAENWDVNRELRLTQPGSYTIRATRKNIVLIGPIQGPSNGTATLYLDAPQGEVLATKRVASNINIVANGSPQAIDPANGRFVTVSTRGMVGTGENAMIIGFVVDGGNQTMLVRAVGPSLTRFGVSGVVTTPVMEILDSEGQLIASNAGWCHFTPGEQTDLREFSSDVGAFALEEGSNDCALLLDLPEGAYTVVLRGQDGATGVALGEVYEVR